MLFCDDFETTTVHNLRFVLRLAGEAREAIIAGRFEDFAADFFSRYQPTDEATRLAQKEKWLAARRAWAEGENAGL